MAIWSEEGLEILSLLKYYTKSVESHFNNVLFIYFSIKMKTSISHQIREGRKTRLIPPPTASSKNTVTNMRSWGLRQRPHQKHTRTGANICYLSPTQTLHVMNPHLSALIKVTEDLRVFVKTVSRVFKQ